MRPDDIVQPTALCIQIIHTFKAFHRGTVLARPDRYQCVNVQWHHKKKPNLMAGRYVELVSVIDFGGELTGPQQQMALVD